MKSLVYYTKAEPASVFSYKDTPNTRIRGIFYVNFC